MAVYRITYDVAVSRDADPSAVLDGALEALDAVADSIATEARVSCAFIDPDEVCVTRKDQTPPPGDAEPKG